ncbi:MAG: methylated-DNA--[protein]-cysteine S-methyltransferase [Neisseriaceae bacterium]|nr:methylated-DNA--[protein]-cysteine S-methyltransferase [Neisseriaceae bacterium]MBP6863258.1 methylated-DNA--[protein]-cysteine S-methyltransferase [Neisseriaceae bacterium]
MNSTQLASYLYPAPFGYLRLRRSGEGISHIDFVAPDLVVKDGGEPLSAFWQPYVQALDAYFTDALQPFPFALAVTGTDFQQRVWAQIAAIPVGETRSYQDLAVALGSHARAVGQACGRNPVPVWVPCHRVVPKNGGLGGFNLGQEAWLLNVKRWLLAHEGVI